MKRLLLAMMVLLAGCDEETVVTLKVRACRATGGYPNVTQYSYQTLAACTDPDGWQVTCPNSYHSGRVYNGCIR